MLKIALSGCNGRMGRAITELASQRDDMEIVAGFDAVPKKLSTYPVYADPFEYAGRWTSMSIFRPRPRSITFWRTACRAESRCFLATTGHSEAQFAALREASEKIAVFKSPNMSLGVAVLGDLVRRATRILGADYDIEIIERHHNQKLDAPSGTAMSLAHDVQAELPFAAELVYDRHERREKRPKNEIGLHAVRGGTIVGEHEVVFAGTNEVISIQHSAQSREVFAAGALHAAKYLAGRKAGFYDMRDLVASIE